ncbi:MAG: DUF6338 family protein [bacterium]|nr:DUF6338 family protein [bacterium]
MPTTVGGLLLFVTLLTPGFVYLAITETRLPRRQYSALRETGRIVSVSLLTNSVVLGVFGLFRSLRPRLTPDVGEFIREPSAYFRGNYLEIVAWGAGLLLASVSVAAAVAILTTWSERLLAGVERQPGPWIYSKISQRRRTRIAQESGWGAAFLRHPDRRVYLTLRLTDGTLLYGPLREFNSQIEETDDRSLQLAAPVEMRTLSGDELTDVDADAVIVAASQIKTIFVHYLPNENPTSEARPTAGGVAMQPK